MMKQEQMKDMQEQLMAMMKHERDEVRRDLVAMMRSSLFDQAVARSTKISQIMVSQPRQEDALLQVPATSGTQATTDACETKQEAGNATQEVLLSASSTRASTSGESNEQLSGRLRCLEERVAKLAEQLPWHLGDDTLKKWDGDWTPRQTQNSQACNASKEVSASEHARPSSAFQHSLQCRSHRRPKETRWMKRHRSPDNGFRGTTNSYSRVSGGSWSRQIHMAI